MVFKGIWYTEYEVIHNIINTIDLDLRMKLRAMQLQYSVGRYGLEVM